MKIIIWTNLQETRRSISDTSSKCAASTAGAIWWRGKSVSRFSLHRGIFSFFWEKDIIRSRALFIQCDCTDYKTIKTICTKKFPILIPVICIKSVLTECKPLRLIMNLQVRLLFFSLQAGSVTLPRRRGGSDRSEETEEKTICKCFCKCQSERFHKLMDL